ncbi:uncharacterized protein [Haliotis asinina]|uniref:uncharacterized protein n=1 Tax=Haliotis asinina TaxID=109174 RepID=UPI0035320F73
MILQVAFVSALLTVPAICSTCGDALVATSSWQSLTYRDNNYPSNQACVWNIDSGPGYIEIQSIYVHIQSSHDCTKGYLRVTEDRPSLGHIRVCGDHKLEYHSYKQGQDVSVHFVTDVMGSGKGFSLKYRTVDVLSPGPTVNPVNPVNPVNTYNVGLTVGLSAFFVIRMAVLGFFIFCLYRHRKGENNLINAPLICDSSATGGRDKEDVFLRVDITEERRDNQLRSGPKGSNSRCQHNGPRPMTGHNNVVFQADERSESEDTLCHDDISVLIHATNPTEELYLHGENTRRIDPRRAGRIDGQPNVQEMNRARGRKTRPGKHAACDNRGYHDAGSHGDARDAYTQGQRNGREKNASRMDVEVEIDNTEPMIRGGKLFFTQSSKEESII